VLPTFRQSSRTDSGAVWADASAPAKMPTVRIVSMRHISVSYFTAGMQLSNSKVLHLQ
jgi:hypothetical protein